MASFKTILFMRIFFGLSYLPFLYSAGKVFINMFLYGPNGLFHNSFMIDNELDVGFFILVTYAFSRFIFIEYKIDNHTLIEKHPLGPRKFYPISEINLIEEDGEFSKWPRLYTGMNWLRVHFKNGKVVNIFLLSDHYAFLQELKSKQWEINRKNESNPTNA